MVSIKTFRLLRFLQGLGIEMPQNIGTKFLQLHLVNMITQQYTAVRQILGRIEENRSIREVHFFDVIFSAIN
jgi:hypothetical protein